MEKPIQSKPHLLKPGFILGLGLALSVAVSGLSWAQTTASGDALAPFEQSLFSRDYVGEPLPSRLNRLENNVFGESQTGGDAERQARLIKALSAAKEYIPAAPANQNANAQPTETNSPGITRFTPPGSTPAPGAEADASGNSPSSGSGSVSQQINPAPKGDSDYPSVTALERAVFSRDFLREDVAHRLDRLERRAFGQASPQMGLSERVDRLMALYPNAAADVARYTRAASGGDAAASSSIRDLPSDSSQFVGSMDTYTKVSVLEKKFFSGKTYPGELLTQRLNRLEARAYGHTYAGQQIDARVNRLLSTYKIGPKRASSASTPLMTQPDPAKWQSPEAVGYTGSFLSPSQRLGTGYNSGSAANSGYAGSANQAAPQNIQIGAGFSSSSTSSYGFSPEMMSMLPPGMQQQLAGGNVQQSGSTTVMGAPGTVITQQSTSYPGFQTYNGQPLQTYSYYGNPVQSQTQSSTTVIQPNGSAITGPTTFTTQTAPPGLPGSVYAGDPAVMQNLLNLELSVFGQADLVNPVPVRLTRLESTLLHQVYPTLPDAQRLANLQRAFQLQSVGRVMGNGKAANIARTAGSMFLGVPLSGQMNTQMPGMTPYNGMPMNGLPMTGMPYGAMPYNGLPYNGLPGSTQVILPSH